MARKPRMNPEAPDGSENPETPETRKPRRTRKPRKAPDEPGRPRKPRNIRPRKTKKHTEMENKNNIAGQPAAPLSKVQGAAPIVIKVGSNVLTRQDGHLDTTRVSAIVDQVAWLKEQGYDVILVSSGAVACGRREVKVEHDLDTVEQRQLFSALGQVKLIGLYYDLFREYGLHVGQILTMRENFDPGEQYDNQKACMKVMLENGVIPIVNENDTVSVTELMFTDNDELSGLIARMMNAETLILLSNVNGVYTGNPEDKDSKLIAIVAPDCDLNQHVSAVKSNHGRGGMQSKYATAKQLQQEGIRVVIANGERENVLIDLIRHPEEVPHTEFLPAVVDKEKPATITQCEAVEKEKPATISQCEAVEKEETATLQFEAVRKASREVALLTDDLRNKVLCDLADAINQHMDELLKENARDLAMMDEKNPLYDRLKLTPQRLQGIAADMRQVTQLPSPLGRILCERTLSNGLELKRVSVPFGVIGIVYEARPNVTFDVFSLCFKSGNACVLKGGKDAHHSNTAAVALIHGVLQKHGLDSNAVLLLPPTHEATAQMLNAVGYVDLCIPRGGRKLIDFVRQHAKVPVIETGAGVVNTYFDIEGDVEMGARIVRNAKTRRVSVCNALDCLLIHAGRLDSLPALCAPLAERGVTLYADPQALQALQGSYPPHLLCAATDQSFGTEFMDYKMAIKTVASAEEAIAHIARYGSGHSECIITANASTAQMFQQRVDAACVYWNAPTSFTDGAQFGLGAEIGISTQKLGARGPMGLEEITSYKWMIKGEGQERA